MGSVSAFLVCLLISLSTFAETAENSVPQASQAVSATTTTETSSENAELATAVEAAKPSDTPAVKNYATRDLSVNSRKPLRFSFFSLASQRTVDAEKGGASIGSYNYLGVSYRLNRQSQVGFRYVFYYDSAGTKFNPAKRREEQIEHRTDAGDPYITYSHYSLWKSGDWSLAGSGRVYFPFSRYARAAKTVTQLRAEFFLDHPVGKYSNFNYTVKTDYYVQSQKAMVDDEVPRRFDGSLDRYAVRATKIAEVEHYFDFDYSFHKMFSFRPRVGFEESWYNESEENGIDKRHTSYFKAQAGMEYRVRRGLNFTLAMEEKVSVREMREPVQFGRAENYQWMLISYASF